jgi:hypothetical protein
VDPDKVVTAIACGSEEPISASDGITYSRVRTDYFDFFKDKYYGKGSVASDHGTELKWILPNSEVYQTERYGDE